MDRQRSLDDDDASTSLGREPAGDLHPNWRFARYLAAYRGNLSRSEAARRSGIPEALWDKVERTAPSEQVTELMPATIVAAMCVTVGADVETGLQLAGHRPEVYPHLLARPPLYTPPAQSAHSFLGPYIATPHAIIEVLEIDSEDTHRRMAAVYRQFAEGNWQLANRIMERLPDDRPEYWTGFAAAIRAVAEQQTWSADLEEGHANAQLRGERRLPDGGDADRDG